MGHKWPQQLIPVHPAGVNQHWHPNTHSTGYLHNTSWLGEKAKEGQILILEAFLSRPEQDGPSHTGTVEGSLFPAQSTGMWGSHSRSDKWLHSSLGWLRKGWNLKEEHLPGSFCNIHPFYWNKAQENTSAHALEATLLKGIFMIYPVLPEKALKSFGMLYTEFTRELFVWEKNLNMQNKKAEGVPAVSTMLPKHLLCSHQHAEFNF